VQSRRLPVCDTLKGCYLVNINTRTEVLLTGNDSYILDPSNNKGYSIRCYVNGNVGAESNFIKFFFDNKVNDEFGEPRYLDGDSNAGEWINPVPYLESCGVKTVRIEGHIWSTMCFSNQFSINIQKVDGSCNPVAPINAPVKAPTKAPTNAPVASPVSGPISGLRLMYTGVDPSVSVMNLAFDTVNIVDLRTLSLPSSSFNLDALVGSNVQSVKFSNGRTETAAPLAYCGNSGSTFYTCSDLVLGATVNVTINAYSLASGAGSLIASRSATIKIIRTSVPTAPTPAPVAAPVIPPVPGCPIPKVSMKTTQKLLKQQLASLITHTLLAVLIFVAACRNLGRSKDKCHCSVSYTSSRSSRRHDW
jgi:hypothetical protein